MNDLNRRKREGLFVPRSSAPGPRVDEAAEPAGAGPCELAVASEIAGLAGPLRPGLNEIALALARVLDGRNNGAKAQAAAKLMAALDELHKGAAGRRGQLAVVRTMTEHGGA